MGHFLLLCYIEIYDLFSPLLPKGRPLGPRRRYCVKFNNLIYQRSSWLLHFLGHLVHLAKSSCLQELIRSKWNGTGVADLLSIGNLQFLGTLWGPEIHTSMQPRAKNVIRGDQRHHQITPEEPQGPSSHSTPSLTTTTTIIPILKRHLESWSMGPLFPHR